MGLKEELAKRKKMLEGILKEKEAELENVPDGFLRGNRHGKGWQYYHRKNASDKNGTYIRKLQLPLAKALGQKEYDKKIMYAASQELQYLDKLYGFYEESKSVEEIFDAIPISHQQIVTPIQEPEETYIRKWQSMVFLKKGFSDNAPEYYSEKKERMRSKSEVLIANMLLKNGIHYVYEKPLYLTGYGIVHPDFTLLDVKNRRELYWEHLGMLDDREYLDKTLLKIDNYERNGIILGNQLILSWETMRHPLNMMNVERKVKQLAKTCVENKMKEAHE